jgi:hypothetical protein
MGSVNGNNRLEGMFDVDEEEIKKQGEMGS